MLPPAARRSHPVDSIPAKYLHTSYNKVKHPVNAVKWTPEGRRLLTGSTSGEFTLWNGTGFNFETIMQAHDCAIRSMKYSYNDDWLLSADQDGIVKYWQTNFNNVKEIQAHNDPVRDLAFAPTDVKFVTASDDASLKIFDFASGAEETTITGHQWEAKCVDWHPTKGLLVSGSKDHQVKLWDPRSGQCLTTLHGHKSTLAMTKFEPINGVLLATCAREPHARVFDIRMMRDVFSLRGHDKEISSLVWHPIHSNLLTTGGGDGSIFHYLLSEQNRPEGSSHTLSPYDAPNPKEAPPQPIWPRHKVSYAHEYSIWSMDWHPLGHILASGSNDKATRFWTRPRPGEDAYLNDRWHIGQAAAEAKGTWKKSEAARARDEDDEEDETDALPDQRMPTRQSFIPGLPGLGAPSFPSGINLGGPPAAIPPSFANGSAPPFPLPGAMGQFPPQMPDLESLKRMFGDQLPPMPNMPMPPAPGRPGPSMPGLPPGFAFPPGLPPMPAGGLPGMAPPGATPLSAEEMAAGGRRRAPLPSQQESLQAEMRQGRYVKPR